VRDAGITRDSALADAKQPTCTEEEIELYVWEEGIKDSTLAKAHDHGMDAMRYLVMHADKGGWSLAEIAAFGRGESSVKKPTSSPRPDEAEPQPKSPEPEKPTETPEEKQRHWEEEVEEMNRLALLHARGFNE
jgi:hypothetical protein